MIYQHYKDVMKPLCAVMPALTLIFGLSVLSTAAMAEAVSLPMDTLPNRITLPNVSPANSALANRSAYR
ncbi:hypothetical protein GCM10007915_17400 [Psychrobacter pacificensis]|jgi:hypothetical protein|uniref:Uncharacterized protein n=2 Tax=Psychrobacter pacificensis TaxID=112002 RepID=A0ABQ5Z245_9GAMM|nr:hypothetical protein GCM10007915_17400 [Psychrobacter pacificensis]|tara:strand:- start:64 stop:270 length:207 start_codon:yes stop_codon:yes gene_type:complete